MHYKATMGGKQLLQVKSKKGPQESKKWAEHLKKKLEEGWDLGKAKAWKARQLARDSFAEGERIGFDVLGQQASGETL